MMIMMMKKIIVCLIACLVMGFGLAIEIHSPNRPDFYTFPNWLPYQVSSPWTAGSESSFTTKEYFTPWTANDGYWYYASTYALNGIEPSWNGSQWTQPLELIDQTTAPYRQEDYPQYRVDLYGETYDFGEGKDATSLYSYVNNEVVGDDGILYGDGVSIGWTRNKVVETNDVLISRRFCEELQASAFHSLDGWCEREYFSSMAYPETSHRLDQLTLYTLPTNRTVETRRVTGKQDLWKVQDTILETAGRGWYAYYMNRVEGQRNAIYTWWSSTAFDKMGYSVVPQNTDGWMNVYNGATRQENVGEVYNHFAYKCPILNGVKGSEVFPNNPPYRIKGFCFSELIGGNDFNTFNGIIWQDTSIFPTPDNYEELDRFKHNFTFEGVVSNMFDQVKVDKMKLKTTRSELDSQAAVNQAMSVLDRSVYQSLANQSYTPSTNTNYRQVIELGWDRPLGEVYDFTPTYSYPCYKLEEDYTDIDFEETTNYVSITTSEGSWLGHSNNIILNETSSSVGVNVAYNGGYQNVDFSPLLDEVNSLHISPSLSPLYVGVRQTQVIWGGDGWDMTFGVSGADRRWQECTQQAYINAQQSNAFIRVSIHASNGYTMQEIKRTLNEFQGVQRFPVAQADSRIKKCRDVWTSNRKVAEINNHRNYPSQPLDYPNIDIKCEVDDDRTGWALSAWQKWSANQNDLWNCIASREGFPKTTPLTWISFTQGDFQDVIDSVTLKEGEYQIQLASDYDLPHYIWSEEENKWIVGNEGGNVGAIQLVVTPLVTYDLSGNHIPKHPYIEGQVDCHCTTIVDWDWESVTKKDQ